MYINIVYKEEIDSTNDEAKRQGDAGAPEGTLVICETQTKGRGRMGRSWASPQEGLYMSLLLRPALTREKAGLITLITAVAVTQALRNFGVDAGIKWPNDVVVNGKKVCGILTEMHGDDDYYVVVGIGVNVNTREFDPELKDRATSMYLETENEFNKWAVRDLILWLFTGMYEDLQDNFGLGEIKDTYNMLLVHNEQPVVIIKNGEETECMCYGISDSGGLIIERGGRRQELISGEISVRGIYGYV